MTCYFCVDVSLSHFKVISPNFACKLVLLWFNAVARLLLDAAEYLKFLSDNTLGFHAKIWLLLLIFLKNL